MSKVDRRHITNDDEVLGIQRELKNDKVIQIKKYLTTVFATFPNSIIVNVSSNNIVNKTDSVLTLKVNDDTFTIIDGQHSIVWQDLIIIKDIILNWYCLSLLTWIFRNRRRYSQL